MSAIKERARNILDTYNGAIVDYCPEAEWFAMMNDAYVLESEFFTDNGLEL